MANASQGKRALWMLAVVMSLATTTLAADCPTAKQPKTQQALIDLEHQWAKALENKDAAAVGCMLAPEFVDTTADGEKRNREQALAAIAKRKDYTNELSDLKVTLRGDVATVHGANHVKDKSGKEVAVVEFTDVFSYRGGRWKAVSGQERVVSTGK